MADSGETKGETKKMLKPKKGWVVRVSDLAKDYLKGRLERTTRERIDATITELHDLNIRLDEVLAAKADFFVLPEAQVVARTAEAARGAAVMAGVRRGQTSEFEEPIAVRVL